MKTIIESLMQPLERYLLIENAIELFCTHNNYIVVKDNLGVSKRYFDLAISIKYWYVFARALCNTNNISITDENNIYLSTTLPGKHRLEVILGNAVSTRISVCIRVYKQNNIGFADFGICKNYQEMILENINLGSNIIISGGTNSGKTSLLNLMLKYINKSIKVVAIEDTPEVNLDSRDNACSFIVDRNENKYSSVINHALRISPNIIIVGEINVHNVVPAIRLLNSGHHGFITTVHASDARTTIIDAFHQNTVLANTKIGGIAQVINKLVDICINLSSSDKQVREIYYPKKSIYHFFK